MQITQRLDRRSVRARPVIIAPIVRPMMKPAITARVMGSTGIMATLHHDHICNHDLTHGHRLGDCSIILRLGLSHGSTLASLLCHAATSSQGHHPDHLNNSRQAVTARSDGITATATATETRPVMEGSTAEGWPRQVHQHLASVGAFSLKLRTHGGRKRCVGCTR
jgi:hypothetical protein